MNREEIKKIALSSDPASLADYLTLARRIEEGMQSRSSEVRPTVKIAFFASFTAKGIKEALLVKCCRLGLIPAFHIGDYDQYAREILDDGSALYDFGPDIVILFIDLQSILGDVYYSPYDISEEARRELVDEKLSEIKALAEKIEKRSGATILVHNFEVPAHSPLGILENKQAFGFIESVRGLNSGLEETAKKDRQIFIVDYDAFCSDIGKKNIRDEKMYYMGDVKLGWNNIPALADVYLGYIKPLAALSRKCIVLDLDNTLWGGVVGEDGFEGIRLGPTSEGRPFVEFQQCLLSLFKRGVLLAVNSRNNYDEAIKVISQHPHMILKEEHFASIKINWNDKAQNLKSIAEEMNIGLESLVFIDDDKANREIVRAALPQVLVVDLPEDPAFYVKTLLRLNDMNTLQFTDEDRGRGRMYARERLRKEFKADRTLGDYLKGLETVASVERADSFTIPRIAQLTQKTNQFNMTTRRYLEEDIRRFSASDSYLVWSIGVRDKFGDNGIVGAAIVKNEPGKWTIETFLLSCRVIGRKVEEAFLACIIDEARNKKIRTLNGEVIFTKKNEVARDFYKNNGFKQTGLREGASLWEYDVEKAYPAPDCVKLVRKGAGCKD